MDFARHINQPHRHPVRAKTAAVQKFVWIAFGRNDLGSFRGHPLGQATSDDDNSSSGTLSLPTQTALSVAIPAPSLVFGERLAGVVSFQFGNEGDKLAIEFNLCDGQFGVAAYQQPGGVIVARQSKFGSLNIAILSSVFLQ